MNESVSKSLTDSARPRDDQEGYCCNCCRGRGQQVHRTRTLTSCARRVRSKPPGLCDRCRRPWGHRAHGRMAFLCRLEHSRVRTSRHRDIGFAQPGPRPDASCASRGLAAQALAAWHAPGGSQRGTSAVLSRRVHFSFQPSSVARSWHAVLPTRGASRTNRSRHYEGVIQEHGAWSPPSPRWREVDTPLQGNRVPRLEPELYSLMDEVAEDVYEKPPSPPLTSAYAALFDRCTARGFVVPSYRTFGAWIKARPSRRQKANRAGHRAAVADAPAVPASGDECPPVCSWRNSSLGRSVVRGVTLFLAGAACG